MLFLFAFFISSTLRRGDDPYSILGVSRDATSQQIRTAFRKIAFDHHPDRHKGDENSYRIWLRANDAYDILSDPQRKLKYDQDGTVSESDDNQQQQQHQNTNYYGGFGYRGSTTTSATHSYHTPLVTEKLFPYLARDGNEWILFAFQHFDCPSCSDQQKLWEKFAYDIKDYVKVGRLDITQAPNLADELKISSVPQFLSVKMINKSKYEVYKLGGQFSSTSSAMDALFKHWRASIRHFSAKSSSFDDWISNKHKSKVHVVEVRLNSEKSETVHFKYAASKLRHSCAFASVSVKSEDEVRSNWNISFKKLPVVLVFRTNDFNIKPIVIDSKGRRLFDEIDEFSTPIFPILSYSSLKRICHEWCVVHVDSKSNSINSSLVESVYNMPFNTGRMNMNSKIASAFLKNANEKDHASLPEWAVISLNKKKFWLVDLPKINDFVTLCSNLYRSDDISQTMKVKKSFQIPSIPFGSGDIFELAKEKLVENENQFYCAIIVILIVSMFIIYLTYKSKTNASKSKSTTQIMNKEVKDKVESENKAESETNSKDQSNDKVENDTNSKSENENKDGNDDQNKDEADDM